MGKTGGGAGEREEFERSLPESTGDIHKSHQRLPDQPWDEWHELWWLSPAEFCDFCLGAGNESEESGLYRFSQLRDMPQSGGRSRKLKVLFYVKTAGG